MSSNEKYYNAELKEKYLDTIENESTKYITSFPFQKAKTTEEQLNKDIYEMNIDELEYVMREQGSSSVDSAYVNTLRFEQYITWAIENGLLPNNINPITTLSDKREWASQFVAKYRQTVFTRDEILEMCKDLANDIDKALLLALFEGIVGSGYAELLNLRREHLNETKEGNYTATLYDADGSNRTINISKELYEFLVAADKQTEYFNKNGKAESERSATSELEETPYIFKKTTRGRQGGKLDLFYVNAKFTKVYKKVFDLKFIKAKNIETSGIMHMAHKLYSEKGKLTQEELKEIADQYNTSTSSYKGNEQRRTIVIKQILKSDLFKDLYGYEII